MVGDGKFIRRAINDMVRKTVNNMVPTSRRVHIPTVKTTWWGSLEKGIRACVAEREVPFYIFLNMGQAL